MALLPEDFSPSINEVVIGRGKKVITHPGNERFREMIKEHLPEYNAASTKAAKSVILVRVLNQVRAQSRVGAFVKYDSKTKLWYALEEAAARINLAQAFRDASANYRSSKQFKQKKRWDQKTQELVCMHKQRSTSQEHGYSQKEEASCPAVVSPPPSLCSYESDYSFSNPAPAPISTAGLASILDSAMAVIDEDDFVGEDDFCMPPLSQTKPQPQLQQSGDFSMLFDVMENQQMDLTEDPFEPKPIVSRPLDHAMIHSQTHSKSGLGTFWPTTIVASNGAKSRNDGCDALQHYQPQQDCRDSALSLKALLSEIY